MKKLHDEPTENKVPESEEKSRAAIIHLSGLSNLLIPLGNIILPIVLWQALKGDSEFVNKQGKAAVNFNLSFVLYAVLLVILFAGSIITTVIGGAAMENDPDTIIPLLFGSTGFITSIVLLGLMYFIRLIFIIIASIQAGNGTEYRYPLTIRFIK